MNIPDTRIATAYFTDEELQVFLDQEQSNIYYAAADALDVMASDQAYILKIESSGDKSVNGVAVSAELRARAATLRGQGAQGNGSSTVSTGIAIVHNHYRRRF